MSAKATSKKKEFPEGAFFDWTATFDDHAPGPLPSIDIGCNLVDDAFEKDVDEVLLRARRAGLSAIVVTGTSVAASERALAFADANSGKEPHGIDIFATCGVHPHDAKSCDASTIPKLRELAQPRGRGHGCGFGPAPHQGPRGGCTLAGRSGQPLPGPGRGRLLAHSPAVDSVLSKKIHVNTCDLEAVHRPDLAPLERAPDLSHVALFIRCVGHFHQKFLGACSHGTPHCEAKR